MVEISYKVGALYDRRRDIHAVLGGQRQGGISTPPGSDFIILFTGVGGAEHGYYDHWDNQGYFNYFGEGQIGDMAFVRGNAAIQNHRQAGKQLLVFQMLGKGKPCRFFGEFELADSYYRGQIRDREGHDRTAIVFRLRPLEEGALPFENSIRKPTQAELSVGSTVTLRLAQVRTKQELFRRNLVGIERECRLTGIADLRFLRASHIKPWAACSSGNERIDGNNGLLLAPHVDLLFDRGWISFEDSGAVMKAAELPADIVSRMGLKLTRRRAGPQFTSRQTSFLDYHRAQIFDKRFRKRQDPVQDLLEVIAD